MFKFFKKKNKDSSEVSSTGDVLSTVTFRIEGMHCTSCGLNIDSSLKDVPGVKNATTSYEKSKTTVKYDANQVGEAKLKKVIEELGYRVEE